MPGVILGGDCVLFARAWLTAGHDVVASGFKSKASCDERDYRATMVLGHTLYHWHANATIMS